eukprot:COSAG01_NODE_2334_length_7882_cov_105.499807_6_plen_261_part_00
MARTKATFLKRKQGSGAAGRQAKKPRNSVAVSRDQIAWLLAAAKQPASAVKPAAAKQPPAVAAAKQPPAVATAKQPPAVAAAKQPPAVATAKQAAVATAKQPAVAAAKQPPAVAAAKQPPAVAAAKQAAVATAKQAAVATTKQPAVAAAKQPPAVAAAKQPPAVATAKQAAVATTNFPEGLDVLQLKLRIFLQRCHHKLVQRKLRRIHTLQYRLDIGQVVCHFPVSKNLLEGDRQAHTEFVSRAGSTNLYRAAITDALGV